MQVCLAGVVAIILAGATLPCNWEISAGKETADWVDVALPGFLSTKSFDVASAGHFFLFGLLGMLLASLLQKGPNRLFGLGASLAVLLVLAGASELIQLFIEGRHPLWRDFMIDCVGGITGMSLLLVIRLLSQASKLKSQ